MSSSSGQMPEQGSYTEVVTSSGSPPSLEPLALSNSEKPIRLLNLPRELRDKVYAYLLSTEYNKHEDLEHLDTMRIDYKYTFHTAILYTNRQINNEASQTFYIDNLFVHISCSRDIACLSDYKYDGDWRKVFPRGAEAGKSVHPAMEISLLSEGEVDKHHEICHFIVTCQELPAICRSLLSKDKKYPGSMASMKLRLVIGDEVATHEAMAGGEVVESQGVVERCASGGDPAIEGSQATRNKIGFTGPRVRRLLEPFRQLHSLRDPQIMGPLFDEYRAGVIADMTKPLPSRQELFDLVLASFQKAMIKFDSREFASSIDAFETTLHEMCDAPSQPHMKITVGPYMGYTFYNAYQDIILIIWTKLAWAYLETGDIDTADLFLTELVKDAIDSKRDNGQVLPAGHNIAMVYYLETQIREKQYRVGGCSQDRRLHYLRDVVRALEKGLRYEPGNNLLVQELEKQNMELAKEKDACDLMKMVDRLESTSNLGSLEGDQCIPREV
ncbi:hypothetical protein IMSHALPRED_003152 [Imshaugia aleurites]|uniref:Uncharacterized protein n=1 Tax=Imshaugia aleurites TaxID=172621 RepID=A0A8H3J778_9LECA|nr:hypothetical protein IMSHALPRED_003152 [Imshaugia aleurites]